MTVEVYLSAYDGNIIKQFIDINSVFAQQFALSNYQNAGKRSRWFASLRPEGPEARKPPQGIPVGGPKGRRKLQVRRNEVSAVQFASVYYIKFVKFAEHFA